MLNLPIRKEGSLKIATFNRIEGAHQVFMLTQGVWQVVRAEKLAPLAVFVVTDTALAVVGSVQVIHAERCEIFMLET